MKNTFTTCLAILLLNFLSAQEKMITRTGLATFSSKTPVENIYAKNDQVASIFLITQKTIAFNVLLKSFKFEKALMEEHFNEKYVHSDKYPAAKFKGKIDLDIDPNVPKVYKDVNIAGEMELHNVKKPLSVMATIEVLKDKTIKLVSNFKLNLESYKIMVPAIVKDKIAANVNVDITANYK